MELRGAQTVSPSCEETRGRRTTRWMLDELVCFARCFVPVEEDQRSTHVDVLVSQVVE